MNEISRAAEEMRLVRIVPDYTEMAAGSALICCGRTKVICTASVQGGVPSFLRWEAWASLAHSKALRSRSLSKEG